MAWSTHIRLLPGNRLRQAISGALLLLLATQAGPASAQPAEGDAAFPIVVRCSLAGTERLYYLSTVKPDGRAVYLSPDHFSATITVEGKAHTISAKGTGSCADKTIEELRAAGQVIDLN